MTMEEDYLSDNGESIFPLLVGAFSNTDYMASFQWSDRGQILAIDTNEMKIVTVQNGQFDLNTQTGILSAGGTTHANSTAVIDLANSKIISCSNGISFDEILAKPDGDNSTWKAKFLHENVKPVEPEIKTFLLTEVVATDLVVRVFTYKKDGTLEFVIEYKIPFSGTTQTAVTGCSSSYFALARDNSITEIFDYDLKPIRTFQGSTSTDLNELIFLDNDSFILKTKILSTSQNFSLIHYKSTNDETGVTLTKELKSTTSAFQGQNIFSGIDLTTPQKPVVNLWTYPNNYTNSSLVSGLDMTLEGVGSDGSFSGGYSRGIVWFLTEEKFNLKMFEDNYMMAPGSDTVRYSVDWSNDIFMDSPTLAIGEKFKWVIFDSNDTKKFYAASIGAANSILKLYRVMATKITAECLLTEDKQEAYTNEVPIFYGETENGRYGYKQSFSFLIKNNNGESFGAQEIKVATIIVIGCFVVTVIVGIVLMGKAGKKLSTVKTLHPI